MKIRAYLFLVLMCIQSSAQEVNPGAVFTSPDGRFTIRFTDQEMNLSIKDNQTAKITTLGVLTPCYSIKWTGDSKTFVAIEHLAGGSDADIFHFNKDQWHNSSADPLSDAFDHIDVTDENIGTNKIKFVYKADIRSAQQDQFFTYAFTFNPETGSTTGIVEHKIDEKTYEKMHSYSGTGLF
jgi:hypothetical protein